MITADFQTIGQLGSSLNITNPAESLQVCRPGFGFSGEKGFQKNGALLFGSMLRQVEGCFFKNILFRIAKQFEGNRQSLSGVVVFQSVKRPLTYQGAFVIGAFQVIGTLPKWLRHLEAPFCLQDLRSLQQIQGLRQSSPYAPKYLPESQGLRISNKLLLHQRRQWPWLLHDLRKTAAGCFCEFRLHRHRYPATTGGLPRSKRATISSSSATASRYPKRLRH